MVLAKIETAKTGTYQRIERKELQTTKAWVYRFDFLFLKQA